jgi:hypothetical protein
MKKNGYRRKITFEKKKTGSRLRHRSTLWVDRVWLGRCTDRFFDKPKLAQPPGRPVGPVQV